MNSYFFSEDHLKINVMTAPALSQHMCTSADAQAAIAIRRRRLSAAHTGRKLRELKCHTTIGYSCLSRLRNVLRTGTRDITLL